MAAYTASQLEQLWVQAGGSQAQAPTAAAIALAESSGNPSVVNSIGASGLWQIHGLPFAGNPLDPLTNARMAVAKYNAAKGFSPWVTFTNGAYKKYLPSSSGGGGISGTLDSIARALKSNPLTWVPGEGLSVVAGAGQAATSVPGAISDVASGVGSVGSSIGSIATLLTSASFWIRLGEGIAAVLLIFLGLHALTGHSSSAGDQVRTVKRYVPVPV